MARAGVQIRWYREWPFRPVGMKGFFGRAGRLLGRECKKEIGVVAMYREVSSKTNYSQMEKEILKFWEQEHIFQKSIDRRAGAEPFTFYDGPPTANGKPHIGHILTRAIKDIIPRYRTMKGYQVLRKAGWDTHGLPVELEVERSLGIDGKAEIEAYGVESFIEKCKDSVWRYEQEWKTVSERVGFWADMESPYVTYHNDYIESVWWALKKIWEQDLIYKGHKVIPYCTRCGTGLSSHEVAQGYQEITDPSIFVKCRLKGTENTYFLIWTTTPWTLPSNVALTVHPRETYAKVNYQGQELIMAEALVESVLGKGATVLGRWLGQELSGMEYEPLFDFAEPEKNAYTVVTDEFVTLTDGSGIVHTAPAFGEDDARVGHVYDLPFVQLVDDQGLFVEAVTPWAGQFVKDADPAIVENLRERDLLLRVEDYEHSYPFCWRCDTPLIYYARNTWFIRMTEVRDRLLKNNNQIRWLPENIREGRFGKFLENVVDWSLSRERYWGTPLPIWECGCGYRHMVGSLTELYQLGTDVPVDMELHKPHIDQVCLTCPQCSGSMKRVPEVIDCWFDAGSMPFAQWHYPFENETIFTNNFPADFISEAVDQTRGWFYTLLAISTLLFDEPAYRNCIVLGHVQDKHGQKMSKHKGNVVDPLPVIERQGADAVRWYFYSASAPWLPSRFSDDLVAEGQRKFMGTLWNVYAFFVLYANIDHFHPQKHQGSPFGELPILDRWILSQTSTLVSTVDGHLANYRITEAARTSAHFVEQLSNWYVRRSRERFWEKGMEQDKINAYSTLYTVLTTVAKVLAPFVPFLAEEMYQNLVRTVSKNAEESIHLCLYPEPEVSHVDSKLEKDMDVLLDIVAAGRACRSQANIKVRQPLRRMYVKAQQPLPEDYHNVVKEELNVKSLQFVDGTEDFYEYQVKANFPQLGPKFGRLVPSIAQALSQLSSEEAAALQDQKQIQLDVNGQPLCLDRDDLDIQVIAQEGYSVVMAGPLQVVLETALDDELVEEGFVRELVSKIQTMRKEAGFAVQDHIRVYHQGSDRLAGVLERNRQAIMDEVLAEDISASQPQGFIKEWNINGQPVELGVEKL